MFGPTSATGPSPSRNSRVEVSGSVAHAASPEQIAQHSVVVAAPTTPSRITRSPRTSAASIASANKASAHAKYGTLSQVQVSSDTAPTLPRFHGVVSWTLSV